MNDGYIDYSGWMTTPPPPYFAAGTDLYGLSFPADRKRCQAFLDRTFNRVVGRSRFRVMLDRVFFAVTIVKRMSAVTEPFSLEGTAAETDLGFFLLVGDHDNGSITARDVSWLPVYLFVNNGFMISTGREVFGWPKYLASIKTPAEAPSSGPFEASGLVIPRYAPDASASVQQILTLSASSIEVTGVGDGPLNFFRQHCAGADPHLISTLLELPGHPSYLGFGGLPIPVLLVKQFRSADGQPGAVYQSVLRGPIVITEMREHRSLIGDWKLDLGEFDSLPFIKDLGLGEPTDGRLVLETRLAFWCDVDFRIDNARTVD